MTDLGKRVLRHLAQIRLREHQENSLAIQHQRNQPVTAFLHEPACRLRPQAASHDRMSGSERGMSGEVELTLRREDAQSIVGSRVGRCANKCRLGQIGPVSDRLHLLGLKTIAVENDRNRISLERYCGKYIDLL